MLSKQRGFYVDLDAEGKIVSDPSAMTRDDAEIWLGHARRAISRLPPVT
jgi:hypothetical protein